MSLSIEKNSFTFTWSIVNVSLFNFRECEGIFSPPIKSKSLVNIEWCLKFTPIAGKNGELSIEIARRCLGASTFNTLDYDLSFVAADGIVLQTLKLVDDIKKKFYLSGKLFLQQPLIVGGNRNNVLYQDTLTVRFRIWSYSREPDYCFSRTVFYQKKFPWTIKMKPTDETTCVSKVFKLPTLCFKVILDQIESYYELLNIRFNIFITDGKFERSTKCKISVMDADGKEHQELFDFFACSGENPLSFQTCTKLAYLVDDMLSLQWHFTYGIFEIVSEDAQTVSDDIAFQTNAVSILSKNTDVACTTLQEDLLQFYRGQEFCDVTLVADNIPFQAHKSILCARSKVFRDLFRTKGQPGLPISGGYINCPIQEDIFYIKDIKAETMNRMLLYIYTDTFQALKWDCAMHLYAAACKCGIMALKQKCQYALKFELSVSNACQILCLADTFQDEDLKQFAWNFIFEHEEVIGSKEWKILDNVKPSLTNKLLLEVYMNK